MALRLTRVPSIAVEALRLFVVAFGAGLGYQIAVWTGGWTKSDLLGSFNGLWAGAILGALVGYVIGGVLARLAIRTIDRGERALEGLSAEQVIAGSFGAVVAAVFATAVSWPLFLVGPPLVIAPIFLFIVVVFALFGFRIGRSRRDATLGAIGGAAGLAPRTVSASSLPRLVDTSVAIDGRVLDVVR